VSDVPVTEIGRIVSASDGLNLIHPDGVKHPVRPRGWDHFRSKRGH